MIYTIASMPEHEQLRREIERLERLCRRQQADCDSLRRQVERLETENHALRRERDEAVAERKALMTELRQERRQHDDTRRQLEDLVHTCAHLDERIKAHMRRQFGASSERLGGMDTYIPEFLEYLAEWDAQMGLNPLSNDEQETNDSDSDAVATFPKPDDATGSLTAMDDHSGSNVDAQEIDRPTGRRRPENAGGRNPIPENLPRRSSTYVPPEDHPALRGTLTHDQIATTVVPRYEIDAVMVYVADITCPVMRITHASGVVYQETLTPPTVTGRSQVSDAFVIHSAIDKVADHLPSHRQSQRLSRIDCHIERSKLCRWHITLATFLKPLWDAIFAEIQAEPVIGIDDTVHRLIVADASVCKQGRLWAISGTAGICYQFTETREGKWIAGLLEDYSGAVMGDAYAGHNRLLERDDILALFCWAHVRRKFIDSADKRRRKIMLSLIGRLYDLERDIAQLPPDERVVQRQQRAQSILAQIHETLCAWQADPAILPKSGIGRATSYALNLWDGLKRYCTIGAAPIDNNRTERGMRPNALHRKNSLLSATVKGAESYAILLTVIQSALMHDLNPETYLNEVVEAMHHERLPIAQLTPAAYAARINPVCKSRS